MLSAAGCTDAAGVLCGVQEELEHARELASVQRKQATAAAEAMHTIKHHSHGEAPDTPSIRIQLNKKSGGGFGFGFSSVADGLRVESVEPRSPADKAGMLAGQVITRLMGRAASDIEHHVSCVPVLTVPATPCWLHYHLNCTDMHDAAP